MGGYPEEELRLLCREGHFLPTDNYWRDGMAEWGTLAELFPDEDWAAPAGPPVKARSAARWIIPTVAAVLLVIGGVIITVSYFSRKMREAAAPIIQPPAAFDATLPGTAAAGGQKPDDLLNVPELPSDQATSEESAAVLKKVQELSAACRDAERDMLLLGFDPARLTSVDEIEKRRQSIEIVLPRVQAVIDYLDHLDPVIRADLQAKNVPAAQIDAFVADLHRDGKQAALLKYWQEENAISHDMLGNLQMLRQNYGKWHLDGETVVFNDPAMLTAYRASVEKLKKDITDQQAVQAAIKDPVPAEVVAPTP